MGDQRWNRWSPRAFFKGKKVKNKKNRQNDFACFFVLSTS